MTLFPRTSSRVVRLLRLIMLLQSGEGLTVTSLQEALGVSRRTLFRDMRALEEAGCSTQYQRGIGYTINGGLMASFESFTTKELLGLIMLGKFARGHAEQPMINHGLAAIYRSVSAAPTELREACKELMSHISIQGSDRSVPYSVQKHFMVLIRCIDEESVCCVEVIGRDGNGQGSICFMPQTLILAADGWKTVGESVLHDDPVEISLADIASIEKKQF